VPGHDADGPSDLQAADWAGLSWSSWHDLDEARDKRLIPMTPGLYRFRAEGEPGLLYIGESGQRWGRLDDLARARRRHTADYYLQGLGDPAHSSAPFFMICEDAGCHVEVSWALEEHSNREARRVVEAQLIRLHRETMGYDPPIQHHGNGVDAYLRRRAMTLDARSPRTKASG
jgi:hypothetical protein